jgi:hypothetical protein
VTRSITYIGTNDEFITECQRSCDNRYKVMTWKVGGNKDQYTVKGFRFGESKYQYDCSHIAHVDMQTDRPSSVNDVKLTAKVLGHTNEYIQAARNALYLRTYVRTYVLLRLALIQ